MFLNELSSRIQSGADNGARPSSHNYQPAQPGDVVVGFINNSELLAFLANYDNKRASFLLRHPVPPTDEAGMRDALHAKMELETMWELVKFEIRRMFNMGTTENITLRQGPLVVRPATDDVVDGIEKEVTERVAIANVGAVVNELEAALTNISPACSDGCPLCRDRQLAEEGAAVRRATAKLDRIGNPGSSRGKDVVTDVLRLLGVR